MNSRLQPLSLAVAAVLVAVIGAGLAVVGLLLLAVAAGVVPVLDSAHPIVALLGTLAVAATAVAFVSAAALWRHRPWAWVASLAIAVAGVAGAVVAVSTSGAQTPILVGLVLTAALVALLLAPSTRSSVGVD